MKIVDVITSKAFTGFYFDDQRAIKTGAVMDGFTYVGEPLTPSFSAIRQAGEALSVMLVLDDGQIAYGDCAAVQYSGASGRDPLFLVDTYQTIVETVLTPWLHGANTHEYFKHMTMLETLTYEGKKLHTAIRYGVSQALLDAYAKTHRIPVAMAVRKLYQIASNDYRAVPLFAQSGDDRYLNVDKMIIKEVDVLPHALINNIDTKLGRQGELLEAYVTWLKERIITKRYRPEYHPVLHIDVYGTIGLIFDHDVDRMVQYLTRLSECAAPFTLRIEGPIDRGEQAATIAMLKQIKDGLKAANVPLEIVADEWCNTLEDVRLFCAAQCCDMIQVKTPDLGSVHDIIEALRLCQAHGIAAYSGGTCNETDLSAQMTTSIAVALNAAQVLAKPGMGTDEGIMVVYNHMMRELARIERMNV